MHVRSRRAARRRSPRRGKASAASATSPSSRPTGSGRPTPSTASPGSPAARRSPPSSAAPRPTASASGRSPACEVEPRALEALLERLGEQLPFFDLEIARADERGARQVHIISGQCAQGRRGPLPRLPRRRARRHRAAPRRARAAPRRRSASSWRSTAATSPSGTTTSSRRDLPRLDGWAAPARPPTDRRASRAARDVNELVHPDDRPAVRKDLVAGAERREDHLPGRVPRAHRGRRLALAARHAAGSPSATPPGARTRVSGTVADIDERKRAEAAVAERRAALPRRGAGLRASTSGRPTRRGAIPTSRSGSRRCSATARGAARAQGAGDHAARRGARGAGVVRRAMAPDGRAVPRARAPRRSPSSGGVIWQSVSAVPVRDAARPLCRLSRHRGRRHRRARQAEARIEYLATRDALTGLPNRVLLADRARAGDPAGGAQPHAARAARHRPRPLQAGERLARPPRRRRAAARGRGAPAEACCRERHARAPGRRRFRAAAATHQVDARRPRRSAQRMLGVLARPFTVEGRTLTVGASIGIALYPSDGRDFAELLQATPTPPCTTRRKAAAARCRFFEPALNARAVGAPAPRERAARRARAQRAGAALAAGGARPSAQVVGAEALVRWQHPDARPARCPEDFVPLAEDCGLIRAIGEWTLERALSQAGAWQRTQPGRCWFAVNVSARRARAGRGAIVEKVTRRAARERAGRRAARARGDRARADVEPRGEHRDAAPHRRARRALRDRRLRHRLLEPRLPAPAAGRQAEDRPLRSCATIDTACRRRGDRARDRRARRRRSASRWRPRASRTRRSSSACSRSAATSGRATTSARRSTPPASRSCYSSSSSALGAPSRSALVGAHARAPIGSISPSAAACAAACSLSGASTSWQPVRRHLARSASRLPRRRFGCGRTERM